MLQEIRYPLPEIMVSSITPSHDEIFLTPPESQNASLSTSINVTDTSLTKNDNSDTSNCIVLDLDSVDGSNSCQGREGQSLLINIGLEVENTCSKRLIVTNENSSADKSSFNNVKEGESGKLKDGNDCSSDTDKNAIANTTLSECEHCEDSKNTSLPEISNMASYNDQLTDHTKAYNETFGIGEQVQRPPKPKKILGMKTKTSKKRKQQLQNNNSKLDKDGNETISAEVVDLKNGLTDVKCNDIDEFNSESHRSIMESKQNSVIQDNVACKDSADTYSHQDCLGDRIIDVRETAASPSKEEVFSELMYWSIPIEPLSGSDLSLKVASEERSETTCDENCSSKGAEVTHQDKETNDGEIVQEKPSIPKPINFEDSTHSCSYESNETTYKVTLIDYCDKLATDIISNVPINVSVFPPMATVSADANSNITSEHCGTSEISEQDTPIKQLPPIKSGRQVLQSVEYEDGTISRKISMEDDPSFFDPITDALDELKLCVSEFCEVCLQELHAL